MIVIDVETSGLDPKKHSILSIGAVDFIDRRRFYKETKPWDGALLDECALKVNGFTKESIFSTERMELKDAIVQFMEWIFNSSEQTFAGHNIAFDASFIKHTLEIYNIQWRIQSRLVDLHSIAYADMMRKDFEIPSKNKRTNLDLDGILVYVGLPPEPKPHNGLMGAMLEAEAFSRIIYGRKLIPEFDKYSVPDHFKYKI